MGIMEHIFWKTFMVLHSVMNKKSDRSCCVMNEKKKKQTKNPVSVLTSVHSADHCARWANLPVCRFPKNYKKMQHSKWWCAKAVVGGGFRCCLITKQTLCCLLLFYLWSERWGGSWSNWQVQSLHRWLIEPPFPLHTDSLGESQRKWWWMPRSTQKTAYVTLMRHSCWCCWYLAAERILAVGGCRFSGSPAAGRQLCLMKSSLGWRQPAWTTMWIWSCW